MMGVRRSSHAALALAATSFAVFVLAIISSLSRVRAYDEQPAAREQQAAMHVTQIASFTIVGIEARTTNAKEALGDGIIGKQWQKFFAEGIPQKIPHRTDQSFYAVYSDYAGDHNGEYSFLIGAKVKEGTEPPAGLIAKRIDAGKYALITSDRGPFPKVVPAAWQKIFSLEDAGSLKRAYRTDFELYDQRALDPQNGQVDIYIGVKM
jgi:predicted transcriptional regulator YdeE